MSTANADKLKALRLTMDKIEKDFGKGSVMMMGEKGSDPMEVISTGSLGLDIALGIGGFPKGRIIEIYGPESSGKTTVAIHTIAEAQKKGGICAIIDAEHAFDSSYAQRLGVDVDSLLISQLKEVVVRNCLALLLLAGVSESPMSHTITTEYIYLLN